MLGIKCDENGGGAAEEVGHKSEGINSTEAPRPRPSSEKWSEWERKRAWRRER